jgi:hypothetical protein
MIRIGVILILGVFFGMSPKEIKNSVLMKLAGIVVLLCLLFVGVATAFGFPPVQVLALEVSHITVSGLTVAYALLLGVVIKLMRNVLSKANT